MFSLRSSVKSGRSCYDYGFSLKRKKSAIPGYARKAPTMSARTEDNSWNQIPICNNLSISNESLSQNGGCIYGTFKHNQVKFVTRRICAFCSKKRDTCRMCGQCMKVWYCDEKCQKDHWASHRKHCKPINPSQENE